MKTVIAVNLVIEPGNIYRLGNIVFGKEPTVHGSRYRTCRIHLPDYIIHPANHFITVLRPLHRFFIKYRPKDDARAIAVPTNQPFQLTDIFWRCIKYSVFIQNHNSHTVTSRHKLFCHRIMSSPVSIDSHFFQFTKTEFPKGIGNSYTDSCMILVVADAFYLYIFAIQPKTRILIKTNCTETAFSLNFITYCSILLNNSLYFVKNRIVR